MTHSEGNNVGNSHTSLVFHVLVQQNKKDIVEKWVFFITEFKSETILYSIEDTYLHHMLSEACSLLILIIITCTVKLNILIF